MPSIFAVTGASGNLYGYGASGKLSPTLCFDEDGKRKKRARLLEAARRRRIATVRVDDDADDDDDDDDDALYSRREDTVAVRVVDGRRFVPGAPLAGALASRSLDASARRDADDDDSDDDARRRAKAYAPRALNAPLGSLALFAVPFVFSKAREFLVKRRAAREDDDGARAASDARSARAGSDALADVLRALERSGRPMPPDVAFYVESIVRDQDDALAELTAEVRALRMANAQAKDNAGKPPLFEEDGYADADGARRRDMDSARNSPEPSVAAAASPETPRGLAELNKIAGFQAKELRYLRTVLAEKERRIETLTRRVKTARAMAAGGAAGDAVAGALETPPRGEKTDGGGGHEPSAAACEATPTPAAYVYESGEEAEEEEEEEEGEVDAVAAIVVQAAAAAAAAAAAEEEEEEEEDSSDEDDSLALDARTPVRVELSITDGGSGSEEESFVAVSLSRVTAVPRVPRETTAASDAASTHVARRAAAATAAAHAGLDDSFESVDGWDERGKSPSEQVEGVFAAAKARIARAMIRPPLISPAGHR